MELTGKFCMHPIYSNRIVRKYSKYDKIINDNKRIVSDKVNNVLVTIIIPISNLKTNN